MGFMRACACAALPFVVPYNWPLHRSGAGLVSEEGARVCVCVRMHPSLCT